MANAGKEGAQRTQQQSLEVGNCTQHTDSIPPKGSCSQDADSSEAETTQASCEGTISLDPPVISPKDFEGIEEVDKRAIQNALIKAAEKYESLNSKQAQKLRTSVQNWKFLWQFEGNKGLSPRALEKAVMSNIQGKSSHTRPMCWYHQRGFCNRGAKCNYGHSEHS